MKESKKRRAEDQLSPYSTETEKKETNISSGTIDENKQRRKAKANIGNKTGIITNTSGLKGVLSSIKLTNQRSGNDKMSGLNKSFYDSVRKILDKQSNKNLSFLFEQYKSHLLKIEKQ